MTIPSTLAVVAVGLVVAVSLATVGIRRARHWWDSRPTLEPRPANAPPRWLLPVARAGVAAVGATAIVLSYGALYDLALAARIDKNLAWLWPISVDVLAVVSAIAARVFHGGRRLSAFYAWLVLLAFLGLSVWGNGEHAVADRNADGGLILDDWQAILVSSTPPVALALSLHLMLMMGARYGTASAVRDNRRPVPDSGDRTTSARRSAPLAGIGEAARWPVFSHPGTVAVGFVPDRLAAVRDGEDNDPTDGAGGSEDEVLPDPDPLLSVARELSGTGPLLSRTTLITGLRERGHACGTERARRLLASLAAEREPLSRTGETTDPDSGTAVPDSHASLNGAGP